MRSHVRVLLVGLLLWAASSNPQAAAAESISVVLLLGDQSDLGLVSDATAVSTRVAIQALQRLRSQPASAAVEYALLAGATPDAEQTQTIAQADLVLSFSMDRPRFAQRAPALRRALDNGARIYAMHDAEDPDQQLPGMLRDELLVAYARAGGTDNIVAALETVMARDFGMILRPPPPRPLPEQGVWDPHDGRVFARFEEYATYTASQSPAEGQRPWIGLLLPANEPRNAQSEWVLNLIEALEKHNYRVLPVYGGSLHTLVDAFFLDDEGQRRIDALVLAARSQYSPAEVGPVLEKLDVPIFNAVSLRHQSREEWQRSPVGLSLGERFNSLFWPEIAGAIAPTVVAAREVRREETLRVEYLAEVAIASRVERLAERVHRWVNLRYKANSAKRIALIYYNSPAGGESIEAEYLNVPASLWRILQGLESGGYLVEDLPETAGKLVQSLQKRGINVSPDRPGALAQLVLRNEPVLLPLDQYHQWLSQQPASLRDAMLEHWGAPEDAEGMLWRNDDGEAYFVLPMQRFGNVLLAPQPVRGWDLSLDRAMSQLSLPPHHQYLAFYLWLQQEINVDAMVHVGTHGSVEWLPGRDAGLDTDDASEVMVGDVPQIYPFVVAHLGDAMQAKRRGMAAIISHLMPPFAPAELNSELSLLLALADDYSVASQQSEIAASAVLVELNERALRVGVLKDIGIDTLATGEDIEQLRRYLHGLEAQWTPYGLHSFGVAPPLDTQGPTAEAILKLAGGPRTPAPGADKAELMAKLQASGDAEIDALLAGLSGRYIAAGMGGNPIRNPDTLPTGRNVYNFDPTRMPTPGAWQQGQALADTWLQEYNERHDRLPARLGFVGLWDSMRSGGVTHAMMLALLGVKPTWDARGVVTGVEVIPREVLARPRIDITMIPSGRTPPNLIELVDQAVALVGNLDEADNWVRRHSIRAERALNDLGIASDQAARMAAVRIFTAPPGAYGTGIDNVIPASNRWQHDAEIVAVYYRRMGHLYGQGYWGDQPGGTATGTEVFKQALQDMDAILHTYSGDSVAVLDHSSAYRHLGGAAMAVRDIEGRDTETFILNIEAEAGHFETLDRFMGRELRTRYTNPKWVSSMLDEGYAGAGFVNEVTQRLWSFQVATPAAVDGAKWQEFYETYVADRNQLDVRGRFREAGNMLAYQALVDRMIVAANKGYWDADEETLAHLQQVNFETIEEAGVACDADSCSSPEVAGMAEDLDRTALEAAGGFGLDAPGSVPVRGQQLQLVTPSTATPPIARQYLWLLLLFVVALGALYQFSHGRRELPCNPSLEAISEHD